MLNLVLNEEEQAAHKVIEDSFNSNVADFYCSIGKQLTDSPILKTSDTLAVVLLLSRLSLEHIVNTVYEGKVENAPINLKNLGYYCEQVLAEIHAHNLDQKQKSQLIL